jgi:MYXO-CTERM domain-containing protein
LNRHQLLVAPLFFTALPSVVLAAAPPVAPVNESGLMLPSGEQITLHRRINYDVPPPMRSAFARLADETGTHWSGWFDAATLVPGRLFGGGVLVPGAMRSPQIAASHAKALLDRQIDLLAPGSTIADFELVSNDLDSGMRTIGFVQKHHGLRVLGGQVSFRYKNDRLILIGSEALPNVDTDPVHKTADTRLVSERATRWVATDFGPSASPEGVTGPFVLAIRDATGATYHNVLEVKVRTQSPVGLWAVYVDATSGDLVARHQTLMFASGTVRFNAPERWPGSTRDDYPADNAEVSDALAQTSITTDTNGMVNWAGASPLRVIAQATGPEVTVVPQTGSATSATFVLPPSGTVTWNEHAHELEDAQVIAYVATHQVRAYAMNVAPMNAWFATQIQVNVNINDTCNAYSDGVTTNFFKSGMGCENTGRLPDVVAHEFGHGVHFNAIINGVGNFDSPLSEGVSDFLSASLHNDPQMGRGFFFNNSPLRDLDPPNKEAKWPDDINNDPHETGLIIGGALWDLRKGLIQKYGMEMGVAKVNALWYSVLQRAADIPSSYAEVVAANDDDGNLANGTPDICEINAAFNPHGLGDKISFGSGIQTPRLDHLRVTLPYHPMNACPGTMIASANIAWSLREDASQNGTIPMTQTGTSTDYSGLLPTPAKSDVVIKYAVQVTFSDGTSISYPDNPADPEYQLFVGTTIPLYCTDFERDPMTDGWNHSLLSGTARQGSDDWQWGAPLGAPGSDDPDYAYSPTHVFGNDLGMPGWDGKYQPNVTNAAFSPTIDLMGHTIVHLQYRRWLSVEDGVYDHARIYGNDVALWSNKGTDVQHGTLNHIDKEWRFHDVDLSSTIKAGKMQVRFELASDGGFELGGWNIDDVCIVAIPQCGNGVVETGEQCDSGSQTGSSTCNADCTLTTPMARCGNGVVDPGEQCDDGTNDGTKCNANCTLPMPMTATTSKPAGGDLHTLKSKSCGCESTRSQSGAPIGVFLALMLALALGRRRGHARSDRRGLRPD